MAFLFDPRFQAVDANGLPLAGATLTFYRAGTSSKITIYQNSQATTPHPNPVTADSAGNFAAIFLTTVDNYKFILKDALGVTVQTVDRIPVVDSFNDAAFAATRTDIKAFDTDTITAAYLKEAGREGQFIWRTGDYSAKVTADTAEAIYIKADAIATTVGAWVRQHRDYFEPRFGGAVGDSGYQDGIYMERASSSGEPGNGNKFDFHFLKIQDRAAQVAGVNGATGSKVNGLHVFHEFGGSLSSGGRHAIEGNLYQLPAYGPTASGNPDRFYVGVQGQVISWTGDGGTGTADLKGAYFGSSSFAELRDLAFWADNLTGAEINTVIQALPLGSEAQQRVRYHAGAQIASFIGVRGYAFDAGLAISGLGGSPFGYGTGILFGSMNGRNPFDADSSVLAFANAMTLAAGIDLRQGSFSIAPFLAANLSISGSGMQASAPGAGIELGSTTTAGSSLIDFHSSGVNLDYDVRLIAEGGGGGAGQGILTVAATAINLSGELRVSGNKVVGARQGAIANTDATAANIAATVNVILGAMRTHGLIAT